MAQLSYSYVTPGGVPGLILDIAPYEINSELIEEATPGAIKFGMGVVAGTTKGKTIALPTATTDVFEGVVVTNVHELDMDGNVVLKKGEACSVMRFGRIWARVDDVTINVNDPVYLICSGAKAGLFTNVSTSNLDVHAKFVGVKDDGIAPIAIADEIVNVNP